MTEILFVGGGNMAAAMIGGLLRQGTAPAALRVLEVDASRCELLAREFGVATASRPTPQTASARVVVLAVKPQQMPEVCHSIRPHLDQPLVLSIAAGIRARDIARWLGTDQVVRAMPNTPALIGQGASGMAALPQVSAEQRAAAARILGAVGDVVWFDDEALLDPVTALSGSGPAYAFYFIEAMIEAGSEMGLSAEQARRLAVRTFAGAAQLAAQSDEPVRTLRERVTSRGGTTAAALAHMDATGLKQQIIAAIHAANRRARELGDQFGAL